MVNKGENTMKKQLIEIGTCAAHTAETVTAGDNLMWNFGYIEHVLEVKPRGKTQLTIVGTSLGRFGNKPSNEIFTRVINRTTTVVKVAKLHSDWQILAGE
jgi:hypothetical protein